ncbi:hypothetical protein RF11_06318 [Thelohanellus kitauei]|uniref:Uncharacterized protein n=1 Tax=Thelohanellus kitauei TaxID=669202 RepID=A0A0C2MLQ8_THEKT|nr:hypothetical protein RF11_06318 [Thelohanellus kitauei]
MFPSNSFGKPGCLKWVFISDPNKFNLACHFTTKISELNVKYQLNSDSRKKFTYIIEVSLQTQQSFFIKINKHSKSAVFVSYEFFLLLAREKKQFIDAKEIIVIVLNIASEMFGDKK